MPRGRQLAVRRRRTTTGFGAFLIGTGMGLVTNLATADAEQWPSPIRPIATFSWAIGAAVIAATGIRAGWVWWHGRLPHPVWLGDNPYPGLEAYRADRASVFFGRRVDTRDLVERVRGGHTPQLRFVPVVGPSGSGKSSLVLAGLLPVLAGSGEWSVIRPFSPGTSGLDELGRVLEVDVAAEAQQIAAAARAGEPLPRPYRLLAAINAARSARRILLVVDQLEEAANQQPEDDRQAFMSVLLALVMDEPRLCVVVTLRSEWLGRFQQGPGADLFVEPFMVNVLGPQQIREVVTEPARLTDTTFDDGLVDEIVRETGRGDALPLLSALLAELYDKSGVERHVTWAAYREAGGVAGAIARRADATARELGTEMLPAVLNTLLLFVRFDGDEPTRHRVPAASLSTEQAQVVAAFVRSHLLTVDATVGGRSWYDLAHEALLRQWPPLSGYIESHRSGLRLVSELIPLARAWRDTGRRVDYLVSGQRLADLVAWRSTGGTVPNELTEFVTESQRHEALGRQWHADVAAQRAIDAIGSDPETAIGLALAACTELEATHYAGTALYCSLASGLRHVLVGHTRPVVAVAFAPDGRLATASEDRTARIWGADGRLCHVLAGHTGAVYRVAFAADGRLATASRDGTARIWDTDGEVQHYLTGPTRTTYALAFAADGRLATGSADGTVRIWDVHCRLRYQLTGHGDAVLAVAFAADGRLASASDDRTARVWDTDGTLLHENVHSGAVRVVAFAADGRLATGSTDGKAWIWSTDGQLLHELTGYGGVVRSLAFAPDGRLATASLNGSARIWGLDGQPLQPLIGDGGAVRSLAFAPDGRLATGSATGTTRIWGIDGKLLHEFVGHTAPVLAATFAAGGRLATGSADGTARIWDTDGQALHELTGHDGTVYSVVFAADGRLGTGSADGTARIWDLYGQALHELTGHDGTVYSVAFSGDGRLATGSHDGTARIWGSGGELLHELTGHRGTVYALAFSADGRLATGSRDGTARIWARDGRLWHMLTGHTMTVTAVTFSADGRLATGSRDGTARIWDGAGRLLHELTGHAGGLRSVAFATDGRLATASEDHTARIWGGDGRLLHELTGHAGALWSVVFAPDGRLATASEDHTARVWGTDGELLQEMRHDDVVRAAAFAADGRLATASEDHTARIWPSPQPVKDLIAQAQGCTIRPTRGRLRRLAMLPPPGRTDVDIRVT